MHHNVNGRQGRGTIPDGLTPRRFSSNTIRCSFLSILIYEGNCRMSLTRFRRGTVSVRRPRDVRALTLLGAEEGQRGARSPACSDGMGRFGLLHGRLDAKRALPAPRVARAGWTSRHESRSKPNTTTASAHASAYMRSSQSCRCPPDCTSLTSSDSCPHDNCRGQTVGHSDLSHLSLIG